MRQIETRERTSGTAIPRLDSGLIDLGQRGLEAATAAQHHALRSLLALFQESVRFATARMDENSRALRDMSACRTLPEAVSTWSEYLDLSAKQYRSEIDSLAVLCADQTRETLVEIEQAVAVGRRPVVAETP